MHKFSFLMVPLQDIAWVSPQPGDLWIISSDHLLQDILLNRNMPLSSFMPCHAPRMPSYIWPRESIIFSSSSAHPDPFGTPKNHPFPYDKST